ncbi:unnamed protein product [Medioppia subpectinata]|uniref:TFIIS-type domain-containing protein n=1 Tax=Medioppia subpectinata TaxID=1979941 RepID=A0A7R9KCY5_9ACAR|nr:unnamed protein product [Medioppia subpectinata]CAG2101133.1 unnamed protein product [Medioppia subpectinata]
METSVIGAKIKIQCPGCGAEELSYNTAQLRSADEGQTDYSPGESTNEVGGSTLLETFDPVVVRFSDLYKTALEYLRQMDIVRLESVLKEMDGIQSCTPESFVLKAFIDMVRDKPLEAYHDLKKFVEMKRPGNLIAMECIAHWNFSSKIYDTAFEQYIMLLESHPCKTLKISHLARIAICKKQLGFYDIAEDICDVLFATPEGYQQYIYFMTEKIHINILKESDPYCTYVMIRIGMEMPTPATPLNRYFAKLLESNSDNVVFLMTYANYLLLTNHFSSGMRYYQEILVSDPHYYPANQNYEYLNQILISSKSKDIYRPVDDSFYSDNRLIDCDLNPEYVGGMKTIFEQSWFRHPEEYILTNVPMSDEIRYQYFLSIAYYVSEFGDLFINSTRKDTAELFMHHFSMIYQILSWKLQRL